MVFCQLISPVVPVLTGAGYWGERCLFLFRSNWHEASHVFWRPTDSELQVCFWTSKASLVLHPSAAAPAGQSAALLSCWLTVDSLLLSVPSVSSQHLGPLSWLSNQEAPGTPADPSSSRLRTGGTLRAQIQFDRAAQSEIILIIIIIKECWSAWRWWAPCWGWWEMFVTKTSWRRRRGWSTANRPETRSAPRWVGHTGWATDWLIDWSIDEFTHLQFHWIIWISSVQWIKLASCVLSRFIK